MVELSDLVNSPIRRYELEEMGTFDLQVLAAEIEDVLENRKKEV